MHSSKQGTVGECVGGRVGLLGVGSPLGICDGVDDGFGVGCSVGRTVGTRVGGKVAAGVLKPGGSVMIGTGVFLNIVVG